jgi:hypothetical protein
MRARRHTPGGGVVRVSVSNPPCFADETEGETCHCDPHMLTEEWLQKHNRS